MPDVIKFKHKYCTFYSDVDVSVLISRLIDRGKYDFPIEIAAGMNTIELRKNYFSILSRTTDEYLK